MKFFKNIVCSAALMLLITFSDAKLTDYLKKCKKGPEGAQCALENAQATIEALSKNNGEPKYKLIGYMPMHVEGVDLQATADLRVILSDLDFFGFDTVNMTTAQINGSHITFSSHMQRMEMIGKYDIDGRILILPIKGQGSCNITISDFDAMYAAKLKTIERKGKQYYQVEASVDAELKISNFKRVYFKFDSLFNGDKRLGAEMNTFLDENWREVFQEVQQGIENTAAYSIVNYVVNAYLHHTAIDELFDE